MEYKLLLYNNKIENNLKNVYSAQITLKYNTDLHLWDRINKLQIINR